MLNQDNQLDMSAMELSAEKARNIHEADDTPLFAVLPGDYDLKVRTAYEKKLAAQTRIGLREREEAQKASAKVRIHCICACCCRCLLTPLPGP